MHLFSGGDHTFLLTEDNILYACGMNTYGQLGVGDNINKSQFTQVNWFQGTIKQISCGKEHSFILTDNNEIYSCGRNIEGQLGSENNLDQNIFRKVNFDKGEIKEIVSGGYHTILLMKNDDMYLTGWNMFKPEKNGKWNFINSFQKIEFNLRIFK